MFENLTTSFVCTIIQRKCFVSTFPLPAVFGIGLNNSINVLLWRSILKCPGNMIIMIANV